jgi:hypothetical protein
MPRYTQPEPEQSLMLHQLNLGLAFTAAASHQGPTGGRPGPAETENVVPTWEIALMKRKHLRLQYALNCESSVRQAVAAVKPAE